MRYIDFRHRYCQARALWLAWLLSPLLLAGCDAGNSSRLAADEIFPLPSLAAMKSLDDQRADFGERTLLINFWATWCGPCRKEMPDLQKLSDSLDRDRFAVIGVSIDDDRNLAEEFLLDYRIRFTNFHDRDQVLASRLLDIRTLPVTYIVKSDGTILARIDGARSWTPASLREWLGAGDVSASAQAAGASESRERI